MFSELKNNFNGFSMIDVHQNATLSESFEGERSRVIGNRCKTNVILHFDVPLIKSCLTS